MAAKLILLLSRHSGLAPAAFSEMWLAQARAIPSDPGGPLRHLHNRAIGSDMPIENAPVAAFDAVDELWFTDADALATWLADGGPGRVWLAGARALLAEPPAALAGHPRLIWERDDAVARQATNPVKIVTLPVRPAGLSRQAFVDHWIDIHSALALQGPDTRSRLKRLENCPATLPLPPFLRSVDFDGAGAIEFGSQADLAAEFASDHYRNVMAPDEPRFTDVRRSCAIMMEPLPI